MVKPWKILLFPLAFLYGTIIRIRNLLFEMGLLRTTEFHFPVICVGNIAIGGTGKTPHTEYLIEMLSSQFKVAVLSRGYGRETKGFMVVEATSTSTSVGDEPLQMKKKFGETLVIVDQSRVNGVKLIREKYPEIDVIILDDAFQHRHITPGFNILLTSYERLFTDDYLLPVGRLREHRKSRKRADIILVSKSPENLSPLERRMIVKDIMPGSHQYLYFTALKYLDPVNITDIAAAAITMKEIGEMKTEVLLLTGIANPQPLLEYVNKFTDRITHIKYPDHHQFSINDIDRIESVLKSMNPGNKCIITTEKDSVRLMEISGFAEKLGDNIYYIPIEISFLNEDNDEFNNYILNYVRKNKPNSIVS